MGNFTFFIQIIKFHFAAFLTPHKHTWIIIISYFCELNLSYDYIAMTYSKKKGVPVLVSIVGKKVNQGLEVEEALRLYWGNRGKCISKIEAFSTGNAISAHTEGIETLRNEFKEIFPNCGGLVATLGNELPLCFAEKLSNELGVFLGGDTFEEYVGRLSVKQEMPACSLYQSNRYMSMT